MLPLRHQRLQQVFTNNYVYGDSKQLSFSKKLPYHQAQWGMRAFKAVSDTSLKTTGFLGPAGMEANRGSRKKHCTQCGIDDKGHIYI